MNNQENADNQGLELDNMVLVDRNSLNALIEQNNVLRKDVIALVNVFKAFAGLFTGKVTVISIVPAITRIINNKTELEKLSLIIPIIEKYTENHDKEAK